ncbi:dienelactone hydrolase family protein [Chitinophaga nivalis]|uniref:Dienelactone hydrolase family protein n=1 Tax=Chitinophaga nivalis TaxID=2991709 RepID=A0ABT3IL73_9BACT|nr:dienelactone hydrolase family protein [Chitinophaga nivalis]MCW3465815.1 dienelactone hydrolase family protein [Chitinophaga nivalis]MCW3484494.1 dienelactone hydrolase family protein [Chitinophaga nivalis]
MKYIFLFILMTATIHMTAQLKPVVYADGNLKLTGQAIKPAHGHKQKGGILILPAWMGIDAHAKNTATRLSELGYYAFIADIYGENNYPHNTQEASQLVGYYKKNYQVYQTRIKLALDELIKSGANPAKIVVIGYCFGGTGALEAARANMPVQGVVSFHGGLGKDTTRPAVKINAHVLACHGADDPYEPVAGVLAFQQEMKTAAADWQFISYANAVHSFTDPASGNNPASGAAYNKLAANRSWQHMLDFLKEIL